MYIYIKLHNTVDKKRKKKKNTILKMLFKSDLLSESNLFIY